MSLIFQKNKDHIQHKFDTLVKFMLPKYELQCSLKRILYISTLRILFELQCTLAGVYIHINVVNFIHSIIWYNLHYHKRIFDKYSKEFFLISDMYLKELIFR